MGDPAQERRVFEAFLATVPSFAGDSVKNWHQPATDPPDIFCKLNDGRTIGLELTTWIDEAQISSVKREESVEASVRSALQPGPANDTANIRLVWMFPIRRMRGGDAAAFRMELLKLVRYVDDRWSSEPAWKSPQGFPWNDFSQYPALQKYLFSLEFFPATALPGWPPGAGSDWLTFAPEGGAYSPDPMVRALCDRIDGKITKYGAKPGGLDKFHLLVHYDKAWAYNSPVETLDFTFADAARAATVFIGAAPGVFDKIFLFVPFNKEQPAFELYP